MAKIKQRKNKGNSIFTARDEGVLTFKVKKQYTRFVYNKKKRLN